MDDPLARRRGTWEGGIDFRSQAFAYDDSPTIMYEPINSKAIEQAAEYPFLRRLQLKNGDYLMKVLADIRRRSKDGRIAVARQDIPDDILKCKGRRWSGLNRIATKPPPIVAGNSYINRELRINVPRSQMGKSAFGYSRLVRQICRCDMGLLDVDIVNAQAVLLKGEYKDAQAYGALHRYVDQR